MFSPWAQMLPLMFPHPLPLPPLPWWRVVTLASFGTQWHSREPHKWWAGCCQDCAPKGPWGWEIEIMKSVLCRKEYFLLQIKFWSWQPVWSPFPGSENLVGMYNVQSSSKVDRTGLQGFSWEIRMLTRAASCIVRTDSEWKPWIYLDGGVWQHSRDNQDVGSLGNWDELLWAECSSLGTNPL